MSSFLITGTSRGIGLELVRQISADTTRASKVFATSRGQPSEALSKIIADSKGRVVFLRCDVTDRESVQQAATTVETELKGAGLDVVINNVGVQPWEQNGILGMTEEEVVNTFKVNVVTAHTVSAAFVPLLRKGKAKKIVNITSTLGSMALARNFVEALTPSYKVTKAAMNMLTVQYALELEHEGFTVIAVSPGWLKTELGTDYADLSVDVGVKAGLDIIWSATPKDSGKMLNIHVPGWENNPGRNQYGGGAAPW